MLEHRRRQHENITILSLHGRLDALAAPELRPVIDALVNEGAQYVVVDASELESVDSSGIGAIVSLFKRLRQNKGTVCIAALNGQPQKIFHLLRLEKAFALVPTVEQALARLSK